MQESHILTGSTDWCQKTFPSRHSFIYLPGPH